MRNRLGEGYPIFLKMNCNDFLPGGLGPGEAITIAEHMSSLGVDAI